MGPSASFLLALFLIFFAGAIDCCSRCLTTDFCVRCKESIAFDPERKCKDSSKVTAADFSFSGLDKPANTSNPLGSGVNFVSVGALPGLNLLGLSLARIDYAPGGVIPPHTHPRGSEIIIVIEGTLKAGFITEEGRLIVKVLVKGNVFVFPIGLMHFHVNVGSEPAVAIVALNSESPGTIFVANSLFGSDPGIPTEVLTKALRVDKNIINKLESSFPGSTNGHP